MAHYVNNKDLLDCIKDYQSRKAAAIADSKTPPRIPEYFGEAVIQIATRFSRRPNFIGYSFRDEMIADGIEHALIAADKFDPNKSSNPFSYITTMVYFSFIRRIAKEKRQSHIRSRLIQDMPIDSFDVQEQDEDSDFMNNYMSFIQSHQNFDTSSEKKVAKQKIVPRGPLEDFFEECGHTVEPEFVKLDIEFDELALELEMNDDNDGEKV